jgi:hypothetical protein
VDDSYYFAVGCRSCLRNVRVSLVRVRGALGDDFPLVDVAKRLKCSTCGSKQVTVTYLKPSQAVGNLYPLFQLSPV